MDSAVGYSDQRASDKTVGQRNLPVRKRKSISRNAVALNADSGFILTAPRYGKAAEA